MNCRLKAQAPEINVLRSLLFGLLEELLSRFLRPGLLKEHKDLLEICYKKRGAQRADEYIVIGQEAKHIVDRLLPSELQQFVEAIRRNIVTACDYIRLKFPLAHDARSNARVADLKSIETMSFLNILFFVERYPALLPVEQQDEALSFLEMEFGKLHTFDIPPNVLQEERTNVQWNTISHIKGQTDSRPLAVSQQ
ncbi:hypothetical protein HPB48_001328 [Haemaphysalis longicornis]|uniref:Uncharacterized protein n=1 Tax=Haemaphysalis longicornis TaxID=44386 RepID=A0A9J6GLC1_HAELO|nr:hypothetical protein HPB48_001328 [Haemaphysalis longicornis]